MGVKRQDWHRLAPEREAWRSCVNDTGVRFAMGAWLEKREMSREARHGERKDGEMGHVSGATPTETEQVGDMMVQKAKPGVEDAGETGGDVGLSRGREGVEGWVVWALEESERGR